MSTDQELRDEPQTPAWLTLLGIALFFVMMLAFLATRPEGKTAAELAAVAAPAVADAAAEGAAPAANAPEHAAP
jgi:hypothetical protein